MGKFSIVLGFLVSGSTLVSCSSKSDKNSTSPATTISYDAFYVVNGGSSSLSVVDATSGSVKTSIPLTGASFPHHIYLSSDKSMLMVAAPGMDLSAGHDGEMSDMKGSIFMVDAKSGEIMMSKKLDGMPHNATFSPDGKEVWAALMTMPGKLLVMDAGTLNVTKTLDVGDMPAEVTFSKNGKYGFVANGMSNNISVFDATSKALIKTIAVGEDPVGAWPASDGYMYVDNEKGKSISAINVTDLTVARTYDLGFTPGMASLAPNGELWVSDADNGKITYFMKDQIMKMGDITVGKGAHGISFSEDGQMALVSNQFAGSVSMIDVSTHKVMKTTSVGTKPNGIVFRKN